MEVIDGGLHPAVDGQSLDEDEEDEDRLAIVQIVPFPLRVMVPVQEDGGKKCR